MDSKTFEQQLQTILIDEFEVDAKQIHRGALLYDELGIDSIDAVDIMQRITELTGLRIPPERFREVSTLGDVADALTQLQADAGQA